MRAFSSFLASDVGAANEKEPMTVASGNSVSRRFTEAAVRISTGLDVAPPYFPTRHSAPYIFWAQKSWRMSQAQSTASTREATPRNTEQERSPTPEPTAYFVGFLRCRSGVRRARVARCAYWLAPKSTEKRQVDLLR